MKGATKFGFTLLLGLFLRLLSTTWADNQVLWVRAGCDLMMIVVVVIVCLNKLRCPRDMCETVPNNSWVAAQRHFTGALRMNTCEKPPCVPKTASGCDEHVKLTLL